MAQRPEAQPGSKRQYTYVHPAGRKAIYDPEVHIPEMLKMANDGAMVCDYAGEWEISEGTFFRWVQEHQEFRDAYKVAKAAQKRWWFNQAKQHLLCSKGESFNATAWSMCMRNMGVSTDERKIEIDIDGCTPEEGIKHVKKLMSKAQLTPKEGKLLIEMFVAEQSLKNAVYTGNEMEAHVSALEEKLKENAGKT